MALKTLHLIFLFLWIICPTSKGSVFPNTYQVPNNFHPVEPVKVVNWASKSYFAGTNGILIVDHEIHNTSVVLYSENEDIHDLTITCMTFLRAQDCKNSISLMEDYSSDNLLICGNFAINGKCFLLDKHKYRLTSTNFVIRWLNDGTVNQFSFVPKTRDSRKEIYSANCDANGACSFERLLKTPLSTHKGRFVNPTFLNGFLNDDKDHSYMFYRDDSNIFLNDQFTRNGQDKTYAWVSRVCTNDQGGSFLDADKWMTFVRARLVCPFSDAANRTSSYFDYLRAVTRVDQYVFGLFSYPPSWEIKVSAICVYKLDDIDQTLEGIGSPMNITEFYSPADADLGTVYSGSNSFNPGQCPRGRKTTHDVPGSYKSFIEDSSLIVKQSVMPVEQKALFLKQTRDFEFLAVSSASRNPSHYSLFLLTQDGYMQKMDFNSDTLSMTSIDDGPLPQHVSAKKITHFSVSDSSLVISTSEEIFAPPLSWIPHPTSTSKTSLQPSDPRKKVKSAVSALNSTADGMLDQQQNCSGIESCMKCKLSAQCGWGGMPSACRRRTEDTAHVFTDRCAYLPLPPKGLQIAEVNEGKFLTIKWSSRGTRAGLVQIACDGQLVLEARVTSPPELVVERRLLADHSYNCSASVWNVKGSFTSTNYTVQISLMNDDTTTATGRIGGRLMLGMWLNNGSYYKVLPSTTGGNSQGDDFFASTIGLIVTVGVSFLALVLIIVCTVLVQNRLAIGSATKYLTTENGSSYLKRSKGLFWKKDVDLTEKKSSSSRLGRSSSKSSQNSSRSKINSKSKRYQKPASKTKSKRAVFKKMSETSYN